ncbi:unnamed protein product [marine sediment metagenome]|uniref:Uncharacterized protein n=1 Tax=marine sediment metagenome TaxID=412755 RepID=X1RYV2_9ZZZZ
MLGPGPALGGLEIGKNLMEPGIELNSLGDDAQNVDGLVIIAGDNLQKPIGILAQFEEGAG